MPVLTVVAGPNGVGKSTFPLCSHVPVRWFSIRIFKIKIEQVFRDIAEHALELAVSKK